MQTETDKADQAEQDSQAQRRKTAEPQASGEKHNVVKQAMSYLLVGGSSALIELVLFQGLYAMAHLSVAPANIIAVIASTVFNFTVNHSVTFKSTGNPLRSLMLYLILFAFNMA